MNDLAPRSLLSNRALVLGGDTRYGYVIGEAEADLLLGVLDQEVARILESDRKLQQVNHNLNAALMEERERARLLSDSVLAMRVKELEAQVAVLSKVIIGAAGTTRLVLDLLKSKEEGP